MAKKGRTDTSEQELRNFGFIANRGSKDIKKNKKSLDADLFKFFLEHRLEDVLKKQKKKGDRK